VALDAKLVPGVPARVAVGASGVGEPSRRADRGGSGRVDHMEAAGRGIRRGQIRRREPLAGGVHRDGEWWELERRF